MKKLSLLILIASLGSVLPACGEDKKNVTNDTDSGQQPQQDGGTDANTDPGDDSGTVTLPDGGGLDPSAQLSELTEAQGKELCNEVQTDANSQLTENERDAANCIMNFVQGNNVPGSLEECQTELADCVANTEPGVFFGALNLGCDSFDVTTGCTGSATVGDLQGCGGGFSALWAFAKPITTCEALLAVNINDLQTNALAVVGTFQTGYGQCAMVAAACPGAITPPQF